MKTITKFDKVQKLNLTEEQKNKLKDFITNELELALSSRSPQDQLWRESLRLYEGVPKVAVKNTPIENAPNTEITLGAIATDTIYAQAIDLIFSISPLLTVRPTNKANVDAAKGIQKFANYVATNEAGIRDSSDDAIFDDVQLGTGIFYIPWTEKIRKTKISEIQKRGPRVFSIPPEDFITPGGATRDIQEMQWVSARFWYTQAALDERADRQGLDLDGVISTGTVGWVKSRRETLARTDSKKFGDLYEIHDVYCYFDVDGDGKAEDLLVIWERASRKILKVMFNPFDNRPFETMQYQIRAHLFNGVGVMEMLASYQEETTTIHNHRVLNMILANCRLWKSKTGTVEPNFKIWPNRNIEMDNPDDLQGEQLGEIYPSSLQAETMTISLAERRVGASEISSPRPSSIAGSRTPGITALSFLQQANRRFAPAFASMRKATAGAIKQCLLRYQERLLTGDKNVEIHIAEVMGIEDAKVIIETLKSKDFDDAMIVEMTASSSSINSDADKQNALLLVNVLATYYEKTLLLVQIASNPQVPQPVRDVAKKIAEVSGEIIDRTIRTFDQIRDPDTFIIDANAELDKADVDQEGLNELSQIFGQLTATQPPEGTAV